MLKKQVKKFKKASTKQKQFVKKSKKFKDKTLDYDEEDMVAEEEENNAVDKTPGTLKKRNQFNLDVRKKWYQEFQKVPPEQKPLEDSARDALKREAGGIFEREVAASNGKTPKTISKSDFSWIKTVISKGTVSDKIAAYVLLIQDDPIINMAYLRNMVSMAKVGKKRECFMTMDTLIELFLDELLPPNRKLKFFVQQPLSAINEITKGNDETRRRLLLLWFFEDQLKNLYTAFLRALNDAAHDTVEANKERVVVVMQKLLQGHPEQEATLLGNIVNKLGDPSHKIASKVIYTLTKLLDAHPAMKAVVLEEVEKVIFRPNMSKRAQYYSVCFLSQFTFDASDSALANSLISIYFALFKACIKTGEIDSRMMSALLTGVSRAYPFAKSECSILTEHVNTVYKVVHLSSANVAIHAISLLYLVAGDTLTDRFLTMLYKKIGEPTMFTAAHHAMFLSIIFKTLKRDTNEGRILAFIKRLFQIAIHLSVPLICGTLMLVSQVLHSHKTLNLRMEQDATTQVKIEEDPDDDEEEHYVDQPIEITVADEPTKEETTEGEEAIKKEPGGSWYHAAIKPSQLPQKTEAKNSYDPYHRNPLNARGDLAMPSELLQLKRHFHPTVSLFASNILSGSKISYSGDPLQDFTLIRFLDKFVFKNPKKVKPSDEQLTTFARFGRKKYYNSIGLKRLRVNTEEYLQNDEKIIPVDETFMYKYLKEKSVLDKKTKVKKVKDEDDESDIESVGDEEFDEILSKVTAGQKRDLDFMDEIGSLPTEKRGASKADDEEEDDLSGEEDLEDEGSGDGLDEDDGQLDDEDDMSDLDSNAEDFDGDEMDDLDNDAELDSDLDEPTPPKKMKGNKFGKSSKSENLFAAAEEFADILDDDQYQAGSSSALSNRDNAAVKQLKWESNRDRWVKGRNERSYPKRKDSNKKRNNQIKRKKPEKRKSR